MTDDQAILIAASIMLMTNHALHGTDDERLDIAVDFARALLSRIKKQPEAKKAVLSRPTIEERNEAHAEKIFNRTSGRT